MANNPDILPAKYHEFDTLQAILVAAVILKATDWKIPAGEISKLIAAQSPWTSAWAVAKDKKNSTTTQKEGRNQARKKYEKVLRPFIQKWIYLNENMDSGAIELCGLKPRDPNRTAPNVPDMAVVSIKRETTRELITSCKKVARALHYGCIAAEGAPLPAWITISSSGKMVVDFNHPAPDPKLKSVIADLTDQRIKHFIGLKPGVTYYFYYYVVNAAGVSSLSEVVSMIA